MIAGPNDFDAIPDVPRATHICRHEVLESTHIGHRLNNDTERLEKPFQLYTETTACKTRIRA